MITLTKSEVPAHIDKLLFDNLKSSNFIGFSGAINIKVQFQYCCEYQLYIHNRSNYIDVCLVLEDFTFSYTFSFNHYIYEKDWGMTTYRTLDPNFVKEIFKFYESINKQSDSEVT